MDSLSTRQLNRAIHLAADAAHIAKRVSDTDEFMRRFLLHVLPGGFHRIRHYGLLANCSRSASLALVRQLLQVPPQALPSDCSPTDVRPSFVCPHCGHAMIVVQTFLRGEPIRAPPQSAVPP